VKALFDRKGAIYADKPRLPMAGETYTKGMNLALMGCNERWKVFAIVFIDGFRRIAV